MKRFVSPSAFSHNFSYSFRRLLNRFISLVASSANGHLSIFRNSFLFLPKRRSLSSPMLPPPSRLRAFHPCCCLVCLFFRFHFRIRFHETVFRPFQSFHRALSSLFHRCHFPPSFGDAVAIGKGGSCGKCDNRLLFVRSVRVDGDGDHAGVRAFQCESDVECGEFEHAVGGNGGGISRRAVCCS